MFHVQPPATRLLPLIAFFVTSGCSTITPEQQADDLHLRANTVAGEPYLLRVFEGRPQPGAPVFIFIEGDGRAFINRYTVARDPTPAQSDTLALAAAVADLGNVSVIGRPCYHGLQDPACHARLWTTARYSQSVIDSLAAAILKQVDGRFWLFGYSGGGTLAILLADALQPQVNGVLTIAAPLDVHAWTAFHRYTPLFDSNDPSDDLGRYTSGCQQHLIGAADRVVPPALAQSWRWPMRNTRIIAAQGHNDDWTGAVLAELQVMLANCTLSSGEG
jgi:pimeloyl-ACP methyl ester carboxylesterase